MRDLATLVSLQLHSGGKPSGKPERITVEKDVRDIGEPEQMRMQREKGADLARVLKALLGDAVLS